MKAPGAQSVRGLISAERIIPQYFKNIAYNSTAILGSIMIILEKSLKDIDIFLLFLLGWRCIKWVQQLPLY